MNQRQINRLIRKELLRQYKARPRRFQREWDEPARWRRQFAYYLFTAFPAHGQRDGAEPDDRAKQYRFKDWRWYLRYMKGKRLGYEIDLD